MTVMVTRRFDADGEPQIMVFDNADTYYVDEISLLLNVVSEGEAVATFREWVDVAVVDEDAARAFLKSLTKIDTIIDGPAGVDPNTIFGTVADDVPMAFAVSADLTATPGHQSNDRQNEV